MSEKFIGFSQEEINKVSGGTKTATTKTCLKQAFRGQHTGIRRVPDSVVKGRSQQTQSQKVINTVKPPITGKENDIKSDPIAASIAIKNNLKGVSDKEETENESSVNTLEDIDLDSSLSKSLENVLFHNAKSFPKGQNLESNETKDTYASSDSTDSSNNTSILKISLNNEQTSFFSILPPAKTLSDTNSNSKPAHVINADFPFKGISLQDFEVHRKRIQEQNKQKKELLYKAIEHHSKKTAAETRKIEEIKSELTKLDSDLAVDVAILRKQIDIACVHFSNVEKQYMKIEAQFLKAKLDLHNAAEKKELLTEHLCTVIAHNEDRKAQKLSELMEKVGLTASEVPFDEVES